MAHADYDCCAICDGKISYGGDATKEKVCSDCVRPLHEATGCYNALEFVEWIAKNDAEVVHRALLDMGFDFCYYENTIHETLNAKGIDPCSFIIETEPSRKEVDGTTTRFIPAKRSCERCGMPEENYYSGPCNLFALREAEGGAE